MPEDRAVAGFASSGILKLERVFGDDEAARMRDVVWRELRRRYGIERDVPATWSSHPPTGLTTTKKSRTFAAMCGPSLTAALDDLFGTGGWQPPTSFGNVLVTMPNATSWRVPHKIWHSDFAPTLPVGRLAVVKVWALFSDTPPHGGGTPQLAGSHRLFANYLAATGETDYKRAKFGFLRSHPFLKALSTETGGSERNETFTRPTDVDGVPLQVVECSGSAGDVYVTHPWVFHSIADNETDQPRMMRSFAVRAAPPPGSVHELDDAP